MEPGEILCKRFKNEACAVYEIMGKDEQGQPRRSSPLIRYVISTNGTRNLLNFPEILNRNFTDDMVKGLTHALIGIDRLQDLSTIPSRNVNVFHLLRGGLNFRLVRALRDAFGYKWHSSSFVSSQRVRKGDGFDVEEDAYRKFVVPEQATIYTGDIVATGVSIDNALNFLFNYLKRHDVCLHNFILVTIGCGEAEPVLERWHRVFQEEFEGYERTILVYIEGRFAMADQATPIATKLPQTDLLRNYKLGSLHTPEFEYSQFEKVMIPLEGCIIYDGGKKAFEPINHLKEIRNFWHKQYQWARQSHVSLWDEYNSRFPLDPYFEDIGSLEPGSHELLKRRRSEMWWGLSDREYEHLFRRFRWLWTDARLKDAMEPDSFQAICRKKLQYLDSHLYDVTQGAEAFPPAWPIPG